MHWLRSDWQLFASADVWGLRFCFAIPCEGLTEHRQREHCSQESSRELGEKEASSGGV